MTDQPIIPRRTEEEEFKRNVYGHLDAIRSELRLQEDRMDRLMTFLTDLQEGMSRKVDFESLVYAWVGGGFIGLIVGSLMGWAWK